MATRCSRELPGKADRSREEAVQRVHGRARLDERVEELRARDLVVAEAPARDEVLPPQVLDERMVRIVAGRGSLQRISLDGDPASDDLLPCVRFIDDPIANLLQRRGVGMPDPRMGHGLARVHVEVVAGRHLLRPARLRVPEMDSDLRLVRALVRREPDVPIDAREGPAERLGIGDEIRADLLEPRPGVANEPQARFLHGVLVTFLVLREPFFAVVLRQVTEEPEEVRGEVFRFLGHLWPRFADIAAHRLNIGANGRASKTARTEPIFSPRIRYHSQMNAVPAGVFVTMSYNRQTSSPSTNVLFGSTRAMMWCSFPNASRYGSGRLNDSNGPTNDRSSCRYFRAPAKSPFPSAF